MARTLTQEEAEAKVIAYNNDYKLDSTYTGTVNEAYLIHKCGHRYKIGRFKSFFEGKNKCPKCFPSTNRRGVSRPTRITEKDLIQKFKDTFPDGEYKYVSGYTTMDKKTALVKHNCGYEFEVAPKMMFGVKQSRCPKCANKNRGKHNMKDNYLQQVLDSQDYGSDYEWKEEYKNDNKLKHLILHKTCGRTYLVRPNDFQQGYKCPHCNAEKKESYHIKLIKDILKASNVNYKTEIKFNSLGDLRFDLLVRNILIEYDGQQHFKRGFKKTEDEFLKQIKRDMKKNSWIQTQKDYSLIRIPYTISDSDLETVITNIIEGKLSKKIIDKNKLYVYNKNKQLVYNTYDYYTCINEELANILN